MAFLSSFFHLQTSVIAPSYYEWKKRHDTALKEKAQKAENKHIASEKERIASAEADRRNRETEAFRFKKFFIDCIRHNLQTNVTNEFECGLFNTYYIRDNSPEMFHLLTDTKQEAESILRSGQFPLSRDTIIFKWKSSADPPKQLTFFDLRHEGYLMKIHFPDQPIGSDRQT
jgi:hypothetical protein